MDTAGNADHVMADVGPLDPAEAHGGIPEVVNPASLLLSTQGEPLSTSEMVIDGSLLSNGFNHGDAPHISEEEANDMILAKRDISAAPRSAALPYASSRTGLVYDVRMRFHVEPIPKDSDMHPEDPRRIYEVYNELCQAGLVDDPTQPDLVGDYLLLRIPARQATEDEILACHSQASFDFVMSLKGK